MTKGEETLFQNRLTRHMDELRWLYMELYGNDAMFAELCDNLYRFADERPAALKSGTWSGRRTLTGTNPMSWSA